MGNDMIMTIPSKKKGRKKYSNPTEKPNLPIEIITEILSWLSINHLIKCQIVCKQWHQVIKNRNFIEKQMIRSSQTIQYQCDYEENGEKFAFVINFAGLVLERGLVSNKYRIRNLKLCKVFDLPDTKHKPVEIGITSARHCGRFKVVSLFDFLNGTHCGGFEILKLGNKKRPKWKTIETKFLRHFNSKTRPFWMLLFNGVAYFATIVTVSGYCEVVCLNLENEYCFTTAVINLSRSFFPAEINNIRALIWGKSFSLAEIANDKLSVLVLEDYKKGKWGEKKIVIQLEFLKENQEMKENLEVYSIVPDKKRILFRWKRESAVTFTYFTYNSEREKIMESSTPENEKIFSVGDSLVTFKGMKPWSGYNRLLENAVDIN